MECSRAICCCKTARSLSTASPLPTQRRLNMGFHESGGSGCAAWWCVRSVPFWQQSRPLPFTGTFFPKTGRLRQPLLPKREAETFPKEEGAGSQKGNASTVAAWAFSRSHNRFLRKDDAPIDKKDKENRRAPAKRRLHELTRSQRRRSDQDASLVQSRLCSRVELRRRLRCARPHHPIHLSHRV